MSRMQGFFPDDELAGRRRTSQRAETTRRQRSEEQEHRGPARGRFPTTAETVEREANRLVGYVCERYPKNRHVRRVTSWIGFILKAIERVAGETLQHKSVRQMKFSYRGHEFKARFNHKAGTRGGIDIVEVLPRHGKPDGEVVVSIRCLSDAEDVYNTLKVHLDNFVDL